MTRGSVGVPAELETHAALRYSAAGGRVPRSDGGVYCSAHDLAMFAMFHLKAHRSDQKQVLTDTSIGAMQNETVKAGNNRQYGLGWWVDNPYGYRTLLAQGGTGSDQAWLWMLPDEGISVLVLTSSGNVTTGDILV